jgi:general secretion pathway protein E
MLHSEFIDHLARQGVLREQQALDGGSNSRRFDAQSDIDWVGLTKLTQSAFADELAAFYRCKRVNRGELVGGRFAGSKLSARFLREGRLFPYEDATGTLALAVATPVDNETVRATELALQQPVALAVATAEDIDAALATSLGAEQAAAPAEANAPRGDDDIDDLRDLARGAPVVRALDDLLRMAVDQRGTDLHIEPFGNTLQVRIRVDGMLKPVASPPIAMAKGILSRLKIMSGLNIT